MRYFTKERNIMVDLSEIISYTTRQTADGKFRISIIFKGGKEMAYSGNIAKEIPKLLEKMGDSNLEPLKDIEILD